MLFGAKSFLASMQKPSQNGRQQAKDSLSIRTKNRYLFRLGFLFPIDTGALISIRQHQYTLSSIPDSKSFFPILRAYQNKCRSIGQGNILFPHNGHQNYQKKHSTPQA
jgi:hypothetical protein